MLPTLIIKILKNSVAHSSKISFNVTHSSQCKGIRRMLCIQHISIHNDLRLDHVNQCSRQCYRALVKQLKMERNDKVNIKNNIFSSFKKSKIHDFQEKISCDNSLTNVPGH